MNIYHNIFFFTYKYSSHLLNPYEHKYSYYHPPSSFPNLHPPQKINNLPH